MGGKERSFMDGTKKKKKEIEDRSAPRKNVGAKVGRGKIRE